MSEFNEIYEKRFTINRIVLVIEIFFAMSLTTLFIYNIDNVEYPNLSRDSLVNLGYLMVGLVFQLIVVAWQSHNIVIKKTISLEITLLLSFFTFIGCAIIQFAVTLTLQPQVTQVSVAEIYMFFASAAVAEESLFRGGIVGLFYVGSIKNVQHKNKKLISILISTFAGAISFVTIHVRYFAIPAALLITVLTGILLSIVYAINKNLLVTIIVHVAINVFVTGMYVQTLM
jgi:membrane protease YdiL (CAAX protease family)